MFFDTVIRQGTIVDGTGGVPWTGDVGIVDGRIAAVAPELDPGGARDVIDADGCWVTPGFVDIHTHYDAQVTWDQDLRPSSDHGVTTLVMGNCGVGFAPARRSDRDYLVQLMEGVEDIPGSALHEGIQWGWETFPEYLDFLAARSYAVDVVAQLPHASLRVFAMGERGRLGETPDTQDLAAITASVREALEAGAAGVSISRVNGHQAADGSTVPGTEAGDAELAALAEGMRAAGTGVFQLVPSGFLGDDPGMGLRRDRWTVAEEMEHLRRFIDRSGRPVTFSMSERSRAGTVLPCVLAAVSPMIEAGYPIHPQFASRAGGVLTGLQSHHLFERRPSYLALAGLPLAERVAALRDSAVKSAILAEPDAPGRTDALMDNFDRFITSNLGFIYPLAAVPDYEPDPAMSVAAIAAREQRAADDVLYDLMLADDGNALVAVLISNYADGNLDAVHELLLSPWAVVGLGDAGAHVRFVCDGSTTTSLLTHWVLGRSRGPRIPIELAIQRQTADNARLFGLTDRGTVTEGLRADLNVIDPAALSLSRPHIVDDLPAGGARFLQDATGYRLTMVNGVMVRRDGMSTGAYPGRLCRVVP